ncbi:MAG: cupredoxin domain-containing protein [Actinobacteria bacterium]|nr:cupredoxin domain-containing protein [Actinomycetota bacterium]
MTGRVLATAAALALTMAACSAGNGDVSADATSGAGTGEVSGGAITLDASEFAFSPTCVQAGGGQSLKVTVTNGGSALHNLSVESLGIDEDVQAGESITVELTLPDSSAVPFVCKYHVANGMQGAFLTG